MNDAIPLDIYFTSPDIEEWCTLSQLRDNYNIIFKGQGWYQTGDDFALVVERHGKYKIWLWVRLDPRDEMEKILDLNQANTDNS